MKRNGINLEDKRQMFLRLAKRVWWLYPSNLLPAVRVRETQRERETETDRQTESKQTDRQTQRDRQTEHFKALGSQQRSVEGGRWGGGGISCICSFQFSSKQDLCARKSPYALHLVSSSTDYTPCCTPAPCAHNPLV